MINSPIIYHDVTNPHAPGKAATSSTTGAGTGTVLALAILSFHNSSTATTVGISDSMAASCTPRRRASIRVPGNRAAQTELRLSEMLKRGVGCKWGAPATTSMCSMSLSGWEVVVGGGGDEEVELPRHLSTQDSTMTLALGIIITACT
ncbi:hypothetical protein D9619_005259 [Psilocybe cf. subviscida]|uniref:Uncharacterized protein n=1 Tax=Psilocybe cf. subviscida TaxID=2480587 RepID=A0A8H5BXX5_9AGAR|nr:hypothetical protein D9619_005259 [Psilocybe cf. subviscida]